jgi:hypothetical protein
MIRITTNPGNRDGIGKFQNSGIAGILRRSVLLFEKQLTPDSK